MRRDRVEEVEKEQGEQCESLNLKGPRKERKKERPRKTKKDQERQAELDAEEGKMTVGLSPPLVGNEEAENDDWLTEKDLRSSSPWQTDDADRQAETGREVLMSCLDLDVFGALIGGVTSEERQGGRG